MIDIVSSNSDGMGLYDTQTERAKNILAVQLGALTYEPTLGIDLRYFMQENLQFQNESFKSYLIQVLANYSINVASLAESIENLSVDYIFNLVPPDTDGGLVAR